jgi:hypothetical protein
MKGASLSLSFTIVQMSFCIERSIHWRPNASIPAPIFYFSFFLQDTLDWAPRKKKPKVGVPRNKCSHKQALCILKCLPLVEEKIPHVTSPSTALQMLAQVFMVLIHAHF